MSKVIVGRGMPLGGFIAGPNGGPHNPLGDGGTASSVPGGARGHPGRLSSFGKANFRRPFRGETEVDSKSRILIPEEG
jgi:hypothetical protein